MRITTGPSTMCLGKPLAAIALAAIVAISCGGPRGARSPGGASVQSGCRPGSNQAVRGEVVKLTVDGKKRSYILDVPAGGASTPLPVVLVFHGLGGDAAQMRDWTGMGEQAHERGFVAVHPQGKMVHLRGMVGKGWQIALDDDRDVRLVEEILDQLDATACIDRKRVYAAGFSNGGFFVHFLACKLGSAAIAGIGAVAGGLDGIEAVCGPDVRMPAVLVNGDADPLVGTGLGSMQFWASRNGCTSESPEMDICTRRSGCEGGADVLYCEVSGGGHDWPSHPIDTTDLVLDFFLDRPPVCI